MHKLHGYTLHNGLANTWMEFFAIRQFRRLPESIWQPWPQLTMGIHETLQYTREIHNYYPEIVPTIDISSQTPALRTFLSRYWSQTWLPALTIVVPNGSRLDNTQNDGSTQPWPSVDTLVPTGWSGLGGWYHTSVAQPPAKWRSRKPHSWSTHLSKLDLT